MDMVTIHIDHELKQFVDSQVAQGSFKNIDDYLASVLTRESERQRKLQALRNEIQIGVDQLDRGEGTPLDMDSIIAECNKRYEERRHGKGS